jgi:chemotaxis protein histidine kinase CheA
MRERTAQLGGTMVIESGPGLGTRIAFDLPVTPPDGGDRHGVRGDV